MIEESIRFGFSNIFNKKVLVFALLLYIPLFFLPTIFSIILEYKVWFVLTIIFYFVYYAIILGSLILLGSEMLKRRKEIDYKNIVKNILNSYSGFLAVNVLVVMIYILIYLPSIISSLVLVASPENLYYWIVIFVLNLFFGIYLSFRLVLTPYIYLLDKKDVSLSFKLSWKTTRGNVLKLFLIYCVGSLIILLTGAFIISIVNFIFKNIILFNILILLFQVFLLIYQVFSILFAYNKFFKKEIRKRIKNKF